LNKHLYLCHPLVLSSPKPDTVSPVSPSLLVFRLPYTSHIKIWKTIWKVCIS